MQQVFETVFQTNSAPHEKHDSHGRSALPKDPKAEPGNPGESDNYSYRSEPSNSGERRRRAVRPPAVDSGTGELVE
jgi:hypothetical protein